MDKNYQFDNAKQQSSFYVKKGKAHHNYQQIHPNNIIDFQQIKIMKSDQLIKKSQLSHDQFEKNVPPTYPYAFNKLPQEQKIHIYTALYEEYWNFKKKLKDYQENIQINTAKLKRIQDDTTLIRNISKTKYPTSLKEKDKEIQRLQYQNIHLSNQIKALADAKRYLKIQKMKGKPMKKIVKTTDIHDQVHKDKGTIRDLLKAIQITKVQLINANKQIEQLQKQRKFINPVIKNESIPSVGYQQKIYESHNELVKLKQQNFELKKILLDINEKKAKTFQDLQFDLNDYKSRCFKAQNQLNLLNKGMKQNQQDQIKKLNGQKMQLQDKLRRIIQMPFYNKYTTITSLQSKILKLQKDLKQANQRVQKKNQQLNQSLAKMEFFIKQHQQFDKENKKLRKQLMNLRNQEMETYKLQRQEDQYLQTLKDLKLTGQQPKWKKMYLVNNYTGYPLQQQVKVLQAQKSQLMCHIQKLESILKSLKSSQRSRQVYFSKTKKQLEQKLFACMKKNDQYSAMISFGKPSRDIFVEKEVSYDGPIQEFEQINDQPIIFGQNWFDLYLGNIKIEQTIIAKITLGKFINPKNILTFLTIDFFTHQTQHTKIVEGLIADYNFKGSFKVKCDEFLVKFFEKEYVKVEIWLSEGTNAPYLGTGYIELKKLMKKSVDRIAPVVSQMVAIYSQKNELIALLNYKMRMRYPVAQFSQWKRQRKHLMFENEDEDDHMGFTIKRQLVIQITKGQGFQGNSDFFVYFNLQNRDYYTQSQRGRQPQWNFKQKIQISYTEQFKKNLKTRYVDFYVFNDSVELCSEKEDVLGIARYYYVISFNFTPLINQQTIKSDQPVVNKQGKKVARICVNAYWDK